MTGRKVQLPKGAKIEGGLLSLPPPKPRDAAHAKAMAKAKRQRVVKRGKA